MHLLKENMYDNMKSIYECEECHNPEYYGMFHWHNGHQYCRHCIYDIWQQEEWREKKRIEEMEADREHRKPLYERIPIWRPGDKDYTFPIYSDGVDYSEEEKDS